MMYRKNKIFYDFWFFLENSRLFLWYPMEIPLSLVTEPHLSGEIWRANCKIDEKKNKKWKFQQNIIFPVHQLVRRIGKQNLDCARPHLLSVRIRTKFATGFQHWNIFWRVEQRRWSNLGIFSILWLSSTASFSKLRRS